MCVGIILANFFAPAKLPPENAIYCKQVFFFDVKLNRKYDPVPYEDERKLQKFYRYGISWFVNTQQCQLSLI